LWIDKYETTIDSNVLDVNGSRETSTMSSKDTRRLVTSGGVGSTRSGGGGLSRALSGPAWAVKINGREGSGARGGRVGGCLPLKPDLTEPTEQGYIVRDERPGTPQRTEFTMKYTDQDRQRAVDPRSTQRRAARAVKYLALWSVQLFGFVMIFGAVLVLIGGALIPAVIPFVLGLTCALLRPWRNRRARRAEQAALARRADAANVSMV